MTNPPQDLVEYLGQHMPRDWAEMLQRTQGQTEYKADGKSFPRIPYGSETFRHLVESEETPCRHCQTIRGLLHEPSCDYEQCPACNSQLMSCECEFEGHEWREDRKHESNT